MIRKTVSVSLPRALAERLEEHAGSEGATLSDILRRAIEAYDKSLPAMPSNGQASTSSAFPGGFPWQ
jgi:metal-responsive CopG/Arc/MetJ family transcriptional regulator